MVMDEDSEPSDGEQAGGEGRGGVLVRHGVAETVRDGLRSQISNFARQVADADGLTAYQGHPERYQVPLQHMDALRALMDEMGWSPSQEDVYIDLGRHEWALIQALQDQVSVLADILHEDPEESEFRAGISGQFQELVPLSLVVLLRSRASGLSI
jgi:hypothetical protein